MPVRTVVDIVWIPQPAVIAEAYFAVAEQAQQLVNPTTQAVERISEEIRQNFESEGRPGKWTSLAEGTVERRGASGPILVDTGALLEAATNPGNWDISQQGQEAVAVQNEPTEYSTYHLTGTIYMPVRDWTYVSDEALDEIDEYYLEWVSEPW